MQAWSGCLDRKLPTTCPGQNVRDSVRKSALVLSLWRSDGFAESLPRPVLGWEQYTTTRDWSQLAASLSRVGAHTAPARLHGTVRRRSTSSAVRIPCCFLALVGVSCDLIISSLFLQINRRAQCKGSLHHADWRRGYQVQLLPVAIQ